MKLIDYLKTENISLDVEAYDWREAIVKAGQLMVDLDIVTPSYIDGMIEVITTLGPYAVIAPGVVMPHARPDRGSLKIGLVFLRLKTPVNFGSPNDPVKFVFAFAGIDNKSHTELLRDLAFFLSQSGALNQLEIAKTPNEVRLIIEEFSKRE